MRDLQEQRLDTLRDLVKVTTEHYKDGEPVTLMSCGLQPGRKMRRSWTSALQMLIGSLSLRELCPKAKTIEAQDAKLVADKLLSRRLLLKAKADRLQQEILLDIAKAQVKISKFFNAKSDT